MRFENYRHPKIDILKEGFRPVAEGGGLRTGRLNGRDHFFYIERRLQEGTPFYPARNLFRPRLDGQLLRLEVHDPALVIRRARGKSRTSGRRCSSRTATSSSWPTQA